MDVCIIQRCIYIRPETRTHTHTNATLFHAPIDAHECTETYSEMDGRMDRLAAKQV